MLYLLQFHAAIIPLQSMLKIPTVPTVSNEVQHMDFVFWTSLKLFDKVAQSPLLQSTKNSLKIAHLLDSSALGILSQRLHLHSFSRDLSHSPHPHRCHIPSSGVAVRRVGTQVGQLPGLLPSVGRGWKGKPEQSRCRGRLGVFPVGAEEAPRR